MRARAPRSEKPLHWVGSSKRDLLAFPEQVVDNIGYALGLVQYGGHPPSAKPWKGLGPDIELIAGRLRAAKRDYEARYGKEEKD